MNGTPACQVPGCIRRGYRRHAGRLDFCCNIHHRRFLRRGRYDLETPEQRFLAGLMFMPGGCIEWAKATNRDGYGKFQIGGKTVAVHRYAWERMNGPIPDGMFILHACDNPPCCNTSHMSLGDNAANMQDMLAKGRGWNQKKTRCPYGHPLDSVVSTTGWRYCGECNRISARARRLGVSFLDYITSEESS